MKDYDFNILFSDTKNFIVGEFNKTSIVFIILFTLFCIFVHFEIRSIKVELNKKNTEITQEISNINKKIDFRYFNTTRSLEDIHKLKIDTKTGEVKK